MEILEEVPLKLRRPDHRFRAALIAALFFAPGTMGCEGPADDGPPPRIEAPLEEAPDSNDTTPTPETAVPAAEEVGAFEQLSFEDQVATLSAESPAFREALQRTELVDGLPAGFVRARVTTPSGEKECNRPPSTDEASTLSRGSTTPFVEVVTDPTAEVDLFARLDNLRPGDLADGSPPAAGPDVPEPAETP